MFWMIFAQFQACTLILRNQELFAPRISLEEGGTISLVFQLSDLLLVAISIKGRERQHFSV